MRTAIVHLLLFLPGLIFPSSPVAASDPGVVLYTPYTRISVPPGQSIDYTVDVINNTTQVKNVNLYVAGIPKGWTYELKSGGWSISALSVLGGEKKNVSLHIDVPFKVKKGRYRFSVTAGGLATLPLTVTVSEEGTFKTELTTKQPNMQGSGKSNFTFNAELKNRTAEKQLYSLRSNSPRGWNVTFSVSGRQVASVQVEPNVTENISIQIDPPDDIAAGTYKIPVLAANSSTSAALELEVVVTGSYSLELTTPTGLLSTSVTAGDQKRIALLVKNNGSAPLKNITLNSSAPVNWDVIFDPKSVDTLGPGRSAEVYATIQADKKAIPGDYVTSLEAKVPEVSSKASFRVSVKTSMLYGWIGVLIVGGAVSAVYYLFRKFGRR
ncbi:MAG TPA: NEW3 domain-containing protein [Chryseosolibacter sp.]|jgi:uncharacterized membrane protein|nr:NEW3 domain-containing protein [Chryseosolibacter sp.]